MATLSAIPTLSGVVSTRRVVSGALQNSGGMSGQVNRNAIIEAAVEVFRFTVAPNNIVTYTDLTQDRINTAVRYKKAILGYLLKQNSDNESYKTLLLTDYNVSGIYRFSVVYDGDIYTVETTNGGIIWSYRVSRADGEDVSTLATFSKGSLVAAINELHDSPNLPEGGSYGDILIKRSPAVGDAIWVPPATSAEEDNTRPITAAAVYTEIGNINALLATI